MSGPVVLAAQRLHPLTILFEFLRVVGRFAYAIVVLLAARFFGGRSDFGDAALAVAGIASVLVASLRYLTLRYAIEGNTLVIRSGLVFRKVRTVPLDRIQNVDIRQTVVHRAAGVADLKIETAAGSGAEVELSLLSLDAARRLAGLVRPATPRSEAGAAPPPTTVLWRAGADSLFLMGATHNRAGAILGLFFGLLYFVGDLAGARFDPADAAARSVSGLEGFSAALAAALGLFALLVAGWIASIVSTFVRYHGFTLTEDADGRLFRRFGLATQRESLIPLARVQLLRWEANLPRRWLGYWTVFVETAGSRVDRDSGGASVLCPWIRWSEASPLAARIFPGLDLERLDWRPVSRRAVRRAFVRYALVAVCATGLAAYQWHAAAWAALPAPLAAAYAWAVLRWRALAYASSGGLFVARSGVWTRRVSIVPEGRIQSLGLVETPFQRRLGLASLILATAGAGASDVHVPDLGAPLARALQDSLAQRSAAQGTWAADGV